MPTVAATSGGGRGPNVQYPIGQSPLFQQRLGGGFGYGGSYGLSSQRAGRIRRPGDPLVPTPVPSDLQGLTQTQDMQGDFNPDIFWKRIFGRGNGPTVIDGKVGYNPLGNGRLGELSQAMLNYGGPQRRTSLGASATGFGDLGSADPLRKLIQQRLGGAL